MVTIVAVSLLLVAIAVIVVIGRPDPVVIGLNPVVLSEGVSVVVLAVEAVSIRHLRAVLVVLIVMLLVLVLIFLELDFLLLVALVAALLAARLAVPVVAVPAGYLYRELPPAARPHPRPR
jgi:hypothetical protein